MLSFLKIFLKDASRSRCESRTHVQKELMLPREKQLSKTFLFLRTPPIKIGRMLTHIFILTAFFYMSSIQSVLQAFDYVPRSLSFRSDIAPKTSGPIQLTTSFKRSDEDRSKRIILAHAIVVRTSPPQDGEGQANIGKVDVWYDAGIRDSLAALAVVSESGERVDKKDAAIDSADPAHVSVSVAPLTPGKYTVRYRALSADGHMVSGAWEFQVK